MKRKCDIYLKCRWNGLQGDSCNDVVISFLFILLKEDLWPHKYCPLFTTDLQSACFMWQWGLNRLGRYQHVSRFQLFVNFPNELPIKLSFSSFSICPHLSPPYFAQQVTVLLSCPHSHCLSYEEPFLQVCFVWYHIDSKQKSFGFVLFQSIFLRVLFASFSDIDGFLFTGTSFQFMCTWIYWPFSLICIILTVPGFFWPLIAPFWCGVAVQPVARPCAWY